MDFAVRVQGVSKRFRLYHERNQSLKVAVLRGRRAKYDEFWAVDDVSLDIPRGITYGLIGSNGSGKSTLLKCMARILVPDTGAIEVNGKVSALLELGAGFHPELSGRDNIYLNGSILGLSKREIDARFDEIVDYAGLHDFIDTPVKNYSSGMYVRLGFSIAINVNPEILMVDEVLAVGDEEFQRKCMDKFAEFREQGKTIIIVSHALGAMRSMCDQVAWIDKGKLKAVGPASQVIDDYVQATNFTDTDISVHTAPRQRSSSGLTITGVKLLDGDAQVRTTALRTGDAATVRIAYESTSSIERVVFALGFHTNDGQHVSGPSTDTQDLFVDVVPGTGTVDLHIPRLMLVPGTYIIAAGANDERSVVTYDSHPRALRFDVSTGASQEILGVVSFDGTWRAGAVTPLG